MGSLSLFIISTLAVLGSATAESCVTKQIGSTGIPTFAGEADFPTGGIVNIQNVCPGFLRGLKVVVCVPGFVPPQVWFLDFLQVQVLTNSRFRITAYEFCSLVNPDTPSVLSGYGRRQDDGPLLLGREGGLRRGLGLGVRRAQPAHLDLDEENLFMIQQ